MSNTTKQILELMNANGKAAPEMTHAVKILGNGDMATGFVRFADYFKEELKIVASNNLMKGRTQGAIVGGVIGGTVIAIVCYVKKKKKQKDIHEKEGKQIISTIEKTGSESGEQGVNTDLKDFEFDNE